jgi:cell division protein FtsZ
MPGLINLDFADVRAIMRDAGSALMGIGRAEGENRAVEAARMAIASPLLEVDIAGAQGILFNITGSSSLSLFEVTEAAEEIRAAADPEANIIFGTSFNERLGEEVMITVIATGFDGGKKRQVARHEATGVMDSSVTGQPSRERDFLEELQRQRDEVADDGAYPSTPAQRPNEDQAAAVVGAPRVERSVGDSSASKRTATTYDADDLEIPSFLRRK